MAEYIATWALLIVLSLVLNVQCQLSTCPAVLPGRDGRDGVPGRDGRDGEDGAHGQNGSPGPRGSNGLIGPKGDRGMNGVKGAVGLPGFDGRPGVPGVPGDRGSVGASGEKGDIGPAGMKGECTQQRNIQQFTWPEEHTEDTGVLKSFSAFTKQRSDSLLRISFSGNARMTTSSRCNRWFITLNGTECSAPGAIEAVMYQSSSDNMLKPLMFEGLCSGITSGQLTVALNIGACPRYQTGDAYTGWNSISRLIVEEIN